MNVWMGGSVVSGRIIWMDGWMDGWMGVGVFEMVGGRAKNDKWQIMCPNKHL